MNKVRVPQRYKSDMARFLKRNIVSEKKEGKHYFWTICLFHIVAQGPVRSNLFWYFAKFGIFCLLMGFQATTWSPLLALIPFHDAHSFFSPSITFPSNISLYGRQNWKQLKWMMKIILEKAHYFFWILAASLRVYQMYVICRRVITTAK